MLKILVADDDEGLRHSLTEYLSSVGYQVQPAIDGADALINHKLKGPFDVYLLDVDMPREDGMSVLKKIKAENPGALVIMLTAYSNVPDAVNSMKEGAYNYLSKPVAMEDLVAMIKKALAAKAMVQKIAFSAPLFDVKKNSITVGAGRSFLARSNTMKNVFSLVEKLAKVDTAVLIRGESGTGKELVAKALHFNSLRKDNRFVAVNCSAIPENLIESEFFGHEKGAFTGAVERKIGRFQYATGGTLFLDEVGDISPLMQVKLLRVLQEKRFTPVGSNREVEVDVRIVAATNRDLEKMMKDGTFREDLYYRLNVLPIFLPPLRDRLEDIDVLAQHFVEQFNQKHNRKIKGLRPDALAILKTWKWPGNIRELENVIEHCFVLESGLEITPESLPHPMIESLEAQKIMEGKIISTPQNLSTTSPITDEISGEDEDNLDSMNLEDIQNLLGDDEGDEGQDVALSPMASNVMFSGGMKINWEELPANYHEFKDTMEKQFIIRALKQNMGKINKTARDAGIPKKTLLRKIAKFGIDRKILVEEAVN